MNSDQLNVWLTNVMQEPLPEWVQLGAQDIADEVKRQWGDKARRRAKERYKPVTAALLSTDVLLHATGVKGGGTASLRCTFHYQDRQFLDAYSWRHPDAHGFELILDSGIGHPYSFDISRNLFIFRGVWCADDESYGYDIEKYVTVGELLQATADDDDRDALLGELLKRHIFSDHEHHWIAAAPNVHRCLFCHTLRAKKPNKQAYYRVDDRVKVTSGSYKSPSCKPVRPMRGSYTEQQMDMALRIARDDNFTISSLK